MIITTTDVINATPLPFNKIAVKMMRRDVPVIPVAKKGKNPLPQAWQTKASLVPNDILKWINEYGSDINCGAVATLDGCWMLDADNPDLWNIIEKETGKTLPRTFTVASRKGLHKYWQQTDASRAMGNRKAHDSVYEFDAQVDRRQVVAPGSTHPSGYVYNVVDDCPIVPAPDWLVQWVSEHGTVDRVTSSSTTKGCKKVCEDFDIEDFFNFFEITGDWDGNWFITEVCPIAGYKHEQSLRTGFWFDGKVFGFHCFANGCEGAAMSISKCLAFLNAKNIEEGGESYKEDIWSTNWASGKMDGIDYDFYDDDDEVDVELAKGIILEADNFDACFNAPPATTAPEAEAAVTIPASVVVNTPAPVAEDGNDIEMPLDCMYGELGLLAKECRTPLGMTYPTMLACHSSKINTDLMCKTRINLYVGLIAMPETGKNVTIDRCLRILDLIPKTHYCKATPAGDTQLALLLGDKAGKKGESRLPGPHKMLIVNNEMTDVLKKTGVENSTLASRLCDMWDDNDFEKIIGKESVNVHCRLSWVGGIPAGEEHTERFTELFGSETNFGLYPRFVFGYTNKKYKYADWEPRPVFTSGYTRDIDVDKLDEVIKNIPAQEPAFPQVTKVESISNEAIKMYDEWEPICDNVGRIKYNCKKVAILSASGNHEAVVTAECMAAAIRFAEWQVKLRNVFQPGEAMNQQAEARNKVMKGLKAAGAESKYVSWRRLSHDLKWGATYGDWIISKCIEGLQEAGEICFKMVVDEDGAASEDKGRVILNPAITKNEEAKRLINTVSPVLTKTKKKGKKKTE
jgi:hypothetical protein